MAYPIERGVPIPPSSDPDELERRAIRALEVGDSFFVPDVGPLGEAFKEFAIQSVALGCGVRITVRAMDGGLRVWRVA